MNVEQWLWTNSDGWSGPENTSPQTENSLVLAFGDVDLVGVPERYQELKSKFPNSAIIMSSTAGEIIDENVKEDCVVATVLNFQKTALKYATVNVAECKNSYDCGKVISEKLSHDGLKHVFIISDGVQVNGDQLVGGLNEHFPESVLITGGLAADKGRFSKTLVGFNEAPLSGKIVAVGFYGEALRVGHGSYGGWDEFGPVRKVTKSEGNVLYELDGQSALQIYKDYLGPKQNDLPQSALLFPLSLKQEGKEGYLVRTILSINEEEGSMVFAGDIPQNSEVRFMMANFDKLIEGAFDAAEASASISQQNPDCVMMISCIGRKLVLDQRVEEEVESVKEVFGTNAIYNGFYSNGEISPQVGSATCSLHNQTMTITTYTEV